MPQDPSSGAARSMRTISRMLAESRQDGLTFIVRALATTATEAGQPRQGIENFLRSNGFDVSTHGAQGQRTFQFEDEGVHCTLIEVVHPLRHLSASDRKRFDQVLDRELTEFAPDLVFTFGGSPWELEWRKRARRRGTAVVFGLRNLSYLHAPLDFFRPSGGVDAVLACSAYVLDRYRAFHGVRWIALATPIDLEEVTAPAAHERIFLTFVNPSVAKGVMFFARIAEELGKRRPDLPILVVEGRSHSGSLLAAAALGDFDLSRHESLMVSPQVAHPREIYKLARLVLMPSVWAEPSGRIAAEALINGIPPIVSDRGGLPETCGDGGFVLKLPATLTVKSPKPVRAAEVVEWLELIERLFDDERFYQTACENARTAGLAYHPEKLAPRYREFFANVTRV